MKTIELDYTKQCGDEPDKGHNRWHPDIPPVVHAEPGEEVVMQTRNAFDMQINPSSQAADLLNADLNLVHPLTGPVYVEGAEPGDLLEVNILNIEPPTGDSPPFCRASGSCATFTPNPTSSIGSCGTGSPNRSNCPECGCPKRPSWAPSGWLRPGPCGKQFCCAKMSCSGGAGWWWVRHRRGRRQPRNPSPPRDSGPFRPGKTEATWTSSS